MSQLMVGLGFLLEAIGKLPATSEVLLAGWLRLASSRGHARLIKVRYQFLAPRSMKNVDQMGRRRAVGGAPGSLM